MLLYNKIFPAFNPFQTTNLRLSKLKKFADDNFKFDERKFFKGVENAVGKGEFDLFKQFSLFTVFSKDSYCRHIKTRACLGKG